MKNIFSTDSKLITGPAKIVDSLWLSLLWTVCSIPIITIGASTTAVYYVTLKLVEDEEGGITKQFFSSFKQNFKQATGLWLLMLPIGCILGMNVWICRQNINTLGNILMVVTVGLIFWYLMVMVYLFAVVARYENPWKKQLLISFVLASRNLIKTIFMIAFSAVAAIAVFYFWPAAIIIMGPLALVNSLFIIKAFEKPLGKSNKNK